MDVFMNLLSVFYLRVEPISFKRFSRFKLFFDELSQQEKMPLMQAESAAACLLLANKQRLMGESFTCRDIITIDEDLFLEFNLLEELDGIGLKAYVHLAHCATQEIMDEALCLFNEQDFPEITFEIIETCIQGHTPMHYFAPSYQGARVF